MINRKDTCSYPNMSLQRFIRHTIKFQCLEEIRRNCIRNTLKRIVPVQIDAVWVMFFLSCRWRTTIFHCNSFKTLYFYWSDSKHFIFFNDSIYISQNRTLKFPYPSSTYQRCPGKSTPSRHWTAVIGSYQFRIQIFGMTTKIDNHNSTYPEN